MFRFPLYTITPVLIQAIQQQQLASLNTIACILKTQVKVYNLCFHGGKRGPLSFPPRLYNIGLLYVCVYLLDTHTQYPTEHIYIKCIFFPPERAKLFFLPPSSSYGLQSRILQCCVSCCFVSICSAEKWPYMHIPWHYIYVYSYIPVRPS